MLGGICISVQVPEEESSMESWGCELPDMGTLEPNYFSL